MEQLENDFEIKSPSDADSQKMCDIAEEFFHTAEDPTQMLINFENGRRLEALDPYTVALRKDGDQIIGWSMSLPSSIENMKLFLEGKINERELGERSFSNPSYEALYLMALFVLPEFRGRYIGKKILQKQIDILKQRYPSIKKLYAWPYSKEGEMIVKSFIHDGEEILIPNNLE